MVAVVLVAAAVVIVVVVVVMVVAAAAGATLAAVAASVVVVEQKRGGSKSSFVDLKISSNKTPSLWLLTIHKDIIAKLALLRFLMSLQGPQQSLPP